ALARNERVLGSIRGGRALRSVPHARVQLERGAREMVAALKKRSAGVAALLTAALLLLAACGGGGQGGGSGETPADFKFAMILPGTVEDADYNSAGYEAIRDVEKTFGIATSYQERVAPADAERVARGFINDGYNIIAFHGGQFLTTVTKLAPEFPDVTF